MRLSLNGELREKIIAETSFLDKYYDKIQLRSRAYCIKNNITEETLPQCKCNCGKPALFNNSAAIKGFRIYCSPECHRKDYKVSDIALEKLKDYDWVYEQRVVKEKSIEKIAEELKISTPTVDRWLIKYGIRDTIKSVRSIRGEKLNQLKNKEFLYDLYINQGYTISNISSKIGISSQTLISWLRKHDIPIKKSNEYQRKNTFTSKSEKAIGCYFKRYTDNLIIYNDRKVLNGKELDIFVPELGLAVEYNGIYSHIYRPHETKPCLIKDENYHINKTDKGLEKGVQIIHLFSSEWENNNKVCRGLIRRKLLKNDRINANDCVIKSVKTGVANRFLKYNCIEAEISGNFNAVGLYYGNCLIQVLCYDDNTIIRNCYKIGISIICGFKKLLNFIEWNQNESIYYKVNRRFSNGNLLKSYGFILSEILSPKYYYTNKSYDELFAADVIENICIGKEDYCFYCEKSQYKKIFDCGYLLFKLQ
jgi:transposase-like protein